MNTEKAYSRINGITVSFTMDTGEVVTMSKDRQEIAAEHGYSIHSVSSMLGAMFGHDLEKWLLEHPLETDMQRAIASGDCAISKYTRVVNNNAIELYSNSAKRFVSFGYHSHEEASDDLAYCTKKFGVKR